MPIKIRDFFVHSVKTAGGQLLRGGDKNQEGERSKKGQREYTLACVITVKVTLPTGLCDPDHNNDDDKKIKR